MHNSELASSEAVSLDKCLQAIPAKPCLLDTEYAAKRTRLQVLCLVRYDSAPGIGFARILFIHENAVGCASTTYPSITL